VPTLDGEPGSHDAQLDGTPGRLARVKIGFALPVSGSWATPENVAGTARRAEELGYHSLWTFQRLLSPVDGSWGEMYRSVLDPLIVLSHVAAITTRPRLGVAVVNMPFVTPVLHAKQTATLDVLSSGRLDVGLGLGWADEEYVASGVSKRYQARRAEEFIAALRALWTEDVVEYVGEFYRIPASKAEPKPVQRPHPPILLGGTAPAALRRAGRLADGWVSSSRADLRHVDESIDVVKAAAADAGRDPEALRFVCRGVVRLRPNVGVPGVPGAHGMQPERPLLQGNLDQVREDMAALARTGLTEMFVDLNFDQEVGSPDADPRASRERADEVLTALAPSLG
jgi:probable F420-dependent oxidoreductase